MKSILDLTLRFIARIITKSCYRIRTHGCQQIPTEGPALLVSNHVSWIDALLLNAASNRRIRFIMHHDVYHFRPLHLLFKLMGGIPVSAAGSRRQKLKFIKSTRQALDAGDLVCIFAEGAITRTGMLQQFKGGLEAITKGTTHPIIPIHIGGAWGSFFSYANGKPFSQLPSISRRPISVHFGHQITTACTAAKVQHAVAELARNAIDAQTTERTSLSEMLIKSARKNWTRKAISDSSDKQLSYGQTLTGAFALAKQLQTAIGDKKMIGLLLPPSVGGALTNLAIPLLDRVPVNLNYTAAPEAVASAMSQCEIDTLITSRRFVERFPQLPTPEQVIYLEDILPKISTPNKLAALLKARLAPLGLLLYGSRRRGEQLATVIFSSGSTGEPKGVMLSQHNIISNLEAIRMISAVTPKDNICSALPFFHALGFTATLWLPLLSGFSATYHVNPMDSGTITKLVRQHRSTLLLTTPTFLSGYLRRASQEDFRSLRLVVTGAEKLKKQLAESFYEKFKIRPLEGYGATELAPLITLSLPDAMAVNISQPGNKTGSVGRPIPGVVMKVVDPESRKDLPNGKTGLILVKGPNLMLGYLNHPDKTSKAIVNGWYITGDIGRIDNDGFLHITDRLARFSKIGGEMVPHIKVEDIFYRELQLENNSLAVTSVPDSKKGERLVVVYTPEAGDAEQLQNISKKSNLPNLWRPQTNSFVKVEKLPILGSGKLDLCGLRKLAEHSAC